MVFGGYKWYKLLNFHTWVRLGRPGSDPGQTLDPLADPRPDLGPNGPLFPTWPYLTRSIGVRSEVDPGQAGLDLTCGNTILVYGLPVSPGTLKHLDMYDKTQRFHQFLEEFTFLRFCSNFLGLIQANYDEKYKFGSRNGAGSRRCTILKYIYLSVCLKLFLSKY